jgi:hypothetical protein
MVKAVIQPLLRDLLRWDRRGGAEAKSSRWVIDGLIVLFFMPPLYERVTPHRGGYSVQCATVRGISTMVVP